MPKKGRGTDAVTGEPKLPVELEGALQSLYSNYEKYYRRWEQNAEAQARGHTPPVFIVVCNNTNVSKLVFDYIAGWEKPIPAVNGHGEFGRWAFLEIADPWDAGHTMREFITSLKT